MHRSLIIPDDALMAVRVVVSEYRDVPNLKITPSKGHLLRSVDPATVPFSFASVYQKDTFWPAERCTSAGLLMWGVYRNPAPY